MGLDWQHIVIEFGVITGIASISLLLSQKEIASMKVTINKAFFLEQALPIIDFDRITLAAYGGVLSVASFGNTVNFRVPAYVIDPGQAFLTCNEWRALVGKMQEAPGSMVDIVL